MGAKLERVGGKGNAGLYRRGTRYVRQVTINGRKVQKSAGTLAEARAAKAELVKQRATGRYLAASGTTLAEYANAWARCYRGRTGQGIRPETVAEYQRALELHILPRIGALALESVKLAEIRLVVNKMEAAGKSPGTVRNAIAPLRALYATALEDELVDRNPCAGLRLPGLRLGDRKVRALDGDEVARLLENAPDERGRLLLDFLLQTGLRYSELAGLWWSDLDLSAQRLRVERRYRDGLYGPPKSSYGKRTLPLSTPLTKALAAHKLGSRYSQDGDVVFASLRGTPPDYAVTRRNILNPARDGAGLELFGFHVTRHTYCTNLLRRGVPLLVVSRLAGHHSAAFTLAVYGHVLEDDLPDMDALLGLGG